MNLSLARAMMDLCETASPGTEYFRASNLDVAAITPPTGGVFISPIRVVPPRFFEPHREGKPAAWCEVRDEFGETIDVAAWSTRKSEKVVTLLGAGAILGAEWAADPASYVDDLPLRVFRTPLGWLQARCEGVAVLDAMRAGRTLLDAPASRLAAEDDEHAREIVRARYAVLDRQSVVVPRRIPAKLLEAA